MKMPESSKKKSPGRKRQPDNTISEGAKRTRKSRDQIIVEQDEEIRKLQEKLALINRVWQQQRLRFVEEQDWWTRNAQKHNACLDIESFFENVVKKFNET
ncbi:hypothetical protein L596_012060 [Steinernema carpocapsae]|uniref:Uncharacterized protein n=1 Tax=Steinernema carpocapsae TaxID=34508 RepID=A0A4U5NW99_STECR|nr:hypothetical protein L596_012060 [Steinernema carpocapsae]